MAIPSSNAAGTAFAGRGFKEPITVLAPMCVDPRPVGQFNEIFLESTQPLLRARPRKWIWILEFLSKPTKIQRRPESFALNREVGSKFTPFLKTVSRQVLLMILESG